MIATLKVGDIVMETRKLLPNGLAVMRDVYLDHLVSAVIIVAALFAGGFLLAP